MLLSMCASYVISVHTTYAHPLCYSPASKEVSYTLDLLTDDSNHDLGTPKCGLWKKEGCDSLSLSLSLEVEDNSHQKSLGNPNP